MEWVLTAYCCGFNKNEAKTLGFLFCFQSQEIIKFSNFNECSLRFYYLAKLKNNFYFLSFKNLTSPHLYVIKVYFKISVACSRV